MFSLSSLEIILKDIVGYIWGIPTVALLVLSGVALSIYLGRGFAPIQLRSFFHGIQVLRGKYDDPDDPGEISHFQALMTALSATIGLGNIGIVAIIIKEGGPGAVFWMIVTGLIGMGTKFAEGSLATLFRRITPDGHTHGGPMYYMEVGLGATFRPMAKFYALAIAIGSFGISNMFQTNQAAQILDDSFGIPKLTTGIALMLFTGLVIIGGIKRIANVTSKIVPLMAVTYIIGCLVVLTYHIERLPEVLSAIFTSAFQTESVFGGIAFSIQMAMLHGVKRACFSNEAGLGSAAIAHSAASTKEPIREGVVALLGPFIDTVTICTLSALVILSTGVWQTDQAVGVSLTAAAFDTVISGFGHYFIPVAATLFAFSTLISWSFYGETSMYYLVGNKAVKPYKIIFCVVALFGSIWKIDAVLDFSDIMIGLMIFPNLLAIWLLAPKLKSHAEEYFKKLKNNEFKQR